MWRMTVNVEQVRRLFAAVEGRDLEGMLECYAADVEIHESGSLPYGGVYRGHTGAIRHAAAFVGTWGPFQTPDEHRLGATFLEADDGTVAASFRHRAVDAVAGRRIECPEVGVYELRDGRIVRSRMFHYDTGELTRFLQAAQSSKETASPARTRPGSTTEP